MCDAFLREACTPCCRDEPAPLAQVAHLAHWTLFLWLFAVQAHDSLSQMPDVAWGAPLVGIACFLVMFTAYKCYLDLKEWLEEEAPSTEDAATSDATPASAPSDAAPEAGGAEPDDEEKHEEEHDAMCGKSEEKHEDKHKQCSEEKTHENGEWKSDKEHAEKKVKTNANSKVK